MKKIRSRETKSTTIKRERETERPSFKRSLLQREPSQALAGKEHVGRTGFENGRETIQT
jgi:hypothetical protein